MYSDALKKFVEGHRPAAIVWDLNQVIDLAQKAGLEVKVLEGYVRLVSRGTEFFTTRRLETKGWGPFKRSEEKAMQYSSITFILPVKIDWVEKVEGARVTYTPQVWGCSYDSFGKAPHPDEKLLEVAGVSPVEVALPEFAVTLPRAPWDNSWAYGGDLVEDLWVCFKSEAPLIITPFINQLAELAGIKVTIE